MTRIANLQRRAALRAALGITLGSAAPVWAQSPATRGICVAQIVDTSSSQIDVSKDFLVGSRTAWLDINYRGGLQGKAVRHRVLEVNDNAAGLRAAVDTLGDDPHCLAIFGSVGDRTASQLVGILDRELPDMPHVAPWLHNVDELELSNTFPIFASRQTQIAHAIKSLSIMGITKVGAIYGLALEYAAYRSDIDHISQEIRLTGQSYPPTMDLRDLAQTLTTESPRVLLFIGGTPELVRFSQGVQSRAVQRYIIAMSDVNLQSIQQLGMSRYSPMIATQVVPMVNASLPVVKAYRAALSRFFDEPPSPQSLAGYISARYTFEVLRSADHNLTRAGALQAFAQRKAVDLGGFHITPDPRTHRTAYVTQSMIGIDGRLIG